VTPTPSVFEMGPAVVDGAFVPALGFELLPLPHAAATIAAIRIATSSGSPRRPRLDPRFDPLGIRRSRITAPPVARFGPTVRLGARRCRRSLVDRRSREPFAAYDMRL